MKTWIGRSTIAVTLLMVAILGAALWTAQRAEKPVGFELVRARTSLGRPFAIALWYPTGARPLPTVLLGLNLMSVARGGAVQGDRLPLIVVSHGNGGGPGSDVDLALALASAGYVVAAPAHAGDNVEDSSRLSSPNFWTHRSLELRGTVDYVLGEWQGRDHVDPGRIGAFGFSAGGFAADPRIRAAVLAAPGLGFTFADGGLQQVAIPVQLWTGEQDVTTPFASNGAVVERELARRVEAHRVPGAGHPSFLAPCGLLRPPAVYSDAAGFDRAAFHRRMNTDVVAFFDLALHP